METRTTVIIFIFIVLLLVSAIIGFICNQAVVESQCITDPNMKTAQQISLFFPLISTVLAALLVGVIIGANIISKRNLL